jgi:DedD protein
MGLFSFLKRQSADAPVPVDAQDAVALARRRARQRLTGAVVLVSAGVVGFPLLFETQPRPLSVNTPVEMTRKEATALTRSAAGSAPVVIHETAADAGREVVRPAVAASPVLPPPKPVVSTAVKPVVSKPDPKPVVVVAEKKPVPAKPLSTPKPRPTEPPKKPIVDDDEDGERFVVQVAAYGDASAAREARKKIEKLGLKTYTQVIETSSGQRIRVRVGPFTSKASADQASHKLKAAGMSSSVISL